MLKYGLNLEYEYGTHNQIIVNLLTVLAHLKMIIKMIIKTMVYNYLTQIVHKPGDEA